MQLKEPLQSHGNFLIGNDGYKQILQYASVCYSCFYWVLLIEKSMHIINIHILFIDIVDVSKNNMNLYFLMPSNNNWHIMILFIEEIMQTVIFINFGIFLLLIYYRQLQIIRIMSESTVKKQLLEQDSRINTPAKMLVARDINSWMETHDKNQKNSQCNILHQRPNKFNIHKRPPTKKLMNNNSVPIQQLNDKQTPNFEQFKKRRNQLMKTITAKKWTKQNIQETKAGTAQENGGSNQARKPLQWFIRLPLVHVNEFIAQEHDRKSFEKHTLIPQSKPFFKCSTITTRKSSLKKIDRKQKQKSPYCHYQQSKKRTNSSQVNQIIQQKLYKNNYTGLLASISRKTSNSLSTMQQQKNKIRVI